MRPGVMGSPERCTASRRVVAAGVLAALGLAAWIGGDAAHAWAPGHLFRRRPAASAVMPAIFGLPPSQVTGHWRHLPDEAQLIVTPAGEVWSDRGHLQGRVLPGRPGADVVFGTASVTCAYRVTWQDERHATWRLVGSSPAACPSGRFERPAPL